ncbi:MAG: GrpB family protein [Clostridia bacterium]|nr:GrpB family protein [Clostridia bacterium]
MTRKTEIVEYNPEWEKIFKEEAKSIKKILGKNCVDIQHIGDTSFKGAKICPDEGQVEICFMVIVKNKSEVFENSGTLEQRGYFNCKTFYYKDGKEKMVLYLYDKNNDSDAKRIQEHLSVRDYMIAHTEKAVEYAKHKANIMNEFEDVRDYCIERDKFIEELKPDIDKWNKEQAKIGMGLSLGMCFGMSIGTALGAAMGNIALGMTMGMSIGMCLGIAFGSAKNEK